MLPCSDTSHCYGMVGWRSLMESIVVRFGLVAVTGSGVCDRLLGQTTLNIPLQSHPSQPTVHGALPCFRTTSLSPPFHCSGRTYTGSGTGEYATVLLVIWGLSQNPPQNSCSLNGRIETRSKHNLLSWLHYSSSISLSISCWFLSRNRSWSWSFMQSRNESGSSSWESKGISSSDQWSSSALWLSNSTLDENLLSQAPHLKKN